MLSLHQNSPAATDRTTIPDWERVRDSLAPPGWRADTMTAVREDFDYWHDHLVIPDPSAPSAWTHHYFCDDDGVQLSFDPSAPHEHVCPGCGRVYRGEPWDGAWRTKMHNQAAAQSQRAALLARLDDHEERRRTAVGVLDEIVTRYARDYSAYELHGVNVGKGRVLPQNLDESVGTIGLPRSVRWAGELLPGSTRADASRLAAEVAVVLEPQLGMIHNIHCWIVAALAECAVATGDSELLATATEGEFGARQQILQGIHPEGLWFEVNPNYHFYAVNALLSFVEVAGAEALEPEASRRLLRAVQAPAELAYTDGRVPAYGDGWPDTFLGSFTQTAEVASALLPGATPALVVPYVGERPTPVELWFGAGRVSGPSPERPGRSTVGGLVFGPELLPSAVDGAGSASFVWPGPGIGVLRDARVRVAMRFGPDAGWHDHHDKLAVDAECGGWRSLDLGTTGYGADITVWMRSQAAHNLVVADDRPQPKHAGELVHADERSLTARSSWNGADVRRSLALTGSGWTDEITVSCDPGTPLEWLFHGDGRVVAEAGAQVLLADDELGHGWLVDGQQVGVIDGAVTVTWEHPDAPQLHLELPTGWAAFRAVGPANPSGLPLGVIAVRGEATEPTTVLRATFTT